MTVDSVRAMMNDETRERFDSLSDMISAAPLTPDNPPAERLRAADAKTLLDNEIIQPAGATPTKGWVIPFTVIEKKGHEYQRCFIAWPKDKNNREGYEPEVPLEHVSHYLSAVTLPGAGLFDLKASFYQIPLPFEARAVFRLIADDGTIYELLRLPMGYKLSPELMHLLCSTLAGLPSCVPPALRAPDDLRIDIWIDNIRLCGAE
eukprot:gene10790-biopygen7712